MRPSLLFQMPFSQQPLGRFSPKLAQRWVLTVTLWILKIRMIDHQSGFHIIKKAFWRGFQRFHHPFLSNRLFDLDQTWQKGGYCWWLYKSRKSGWLVANYRFYTIKTDCASVCASIPSISNAFFSATNGSILTKIGTKVRTDSGFMNPENQDHRIHGPNSIL